MEIFKANHQWATRPVDERFPSLQALYDATKSYAAQAGEKIVSITDVRAEADGADVALVGKQGVNATLTHWAFGQLCQRTSAPASYLRELPATLACQNLNYGLANLARTNPDEDQKKVNLLFHTNGKLVLRAFTSDKYSRIWNWEVAERLLGLEQYGWSPARPDKRWDGGDPTKCLLCDGAGCEKCNQTGEAFPALYASDHDMFAFIRNNTAIIREPGNPDGLQRGVIVENSEVGASALKMTRFLYREMCGNHIIWGATKVLDFKIRHVGNAAAKFNLYSAEIRRYAESSASDEEATIASAKTKVIAATKEQVLDKLFGIRALGLSRKTVEAGYDAVVPDQDGDPNTVWGMAQGLTRHSQTIPYADQRTEIDRAAGRLIEVNF